MNAMDTEGFGAPTSFGSHLFRVDIPLAPRDPVHVLEDFGFHGESTQRETVVCRVILYRDIWSRIRDAARRDFNERLKEHKLSTGNWITGTVRLERFLGRELCVLAWAAEHATPDECAIICQKWQALRPEERWWLFAKTAAEAGRAEDIDRGWRKALYCALSDGTGIKLAPRKTRKTIKAPAVDQCSLPNLFTEQGVV